MGSEVKSIEGEQVLISGAAGFLGSYVGEYFAARGCRVIGMDLQLRPEKSFWSGWHQLQLPNAELRSILRATRPKIFVHCAGCASVLESVRDPATDFRNSVELTFAILDALRCEAPDARFVFTSSAAVYGNPRSLPIGDDAETAPISPYGFHKLQCEGLCREFATVYGLPTASARIFSAYGPGLRRQVMWDICAKALSPHPLRLQGTGDESRDFIHAEDIARGLYCLAESGALQGETYNLAGGCEITIAALADHLLKTLGSKKAIEFDGVVPAGNPLRWRADLSRISALGFRPKIDLDGGVEAFARWAREESIRR